jgi:molybdopterin-guanine dinucleotide biosynthesis protein A
VKLGGLVLAGGLSSRFGSEKAVADHKGRPLMAHPVDLLRESCVAVAASVKPGSGAEALARGWGMELLADAPGDPSGPLAGVKSGLLWARQKGFDALAVAPCDTPALPDDLYARLLAALGEAGAAYAVTEQGPQPLCSIWRVKSLHAVADWLSGERHPPTKRLLASLEAPAVMFDDPAAFANFNRPDGLGSKT